MATKKKAVKPKKTADQVSMSQMFTAFMSKWNGVDLRDAAIRRRFLIFTSSVVAAVFFGLAILVGCQFATSKGYPEVGAIVWLFLSFAILAGWLYPIFFTDNRRNSENYFIFLANIQIWLTVAFAAVIFPDYSHHQNYSFLLPVSISIVSLAFAWGYPKTWAKPLIYAGAIMATGIMVVVLTSNVLSPAIFGTDPFAKTNGDQNVVITRGVIEEGEKQLTTVAMLKEFKGEPLTEWDTYYIKKYGDPSFLGWVKALFVSKPAPIKLQQASAEEKPKAETPKAEVVSAPDETAPAIATQTAYKPETSITEPDLSGEWDFCRNGKCDTFAFNNLEASRKGGNLKMIFANHSENTWHGTWKLSYGNTLRTGTFSASFDGNQVRKGVWTCNENHAQGVLTGYKI